ncbi:hypothetical protein AMATHDRAFT_59958 [Amanita thiersii Skay4041]|uniref:Peptidase S54 rhomboid domain-containing protein n=1 Tax=Amanita thiersii Skay4041 TaxID=703135 RepID=A0A2A9NRX7_9AGAR|nr:hypothetical protein AMATHDRAFT_59958 [Amanita thiersii Skay4041]
MFRLLLRRQISPPPTFFTRNLTPTRFFSSTICRANPVPTNVLWQPRAYGKVPSFKESLVKIKPPESFSEKVGRPGMRNQVMFVLAGSWLAFTYAAINTNIETEIWVRELSKTFPEWSAGSITNIDLKRAQNAELIRKLREWYSKLNSAVQDFPTLIKPWISLAYVTVMQPYADMSEGKRLCWKICLLNATVYGFWKIRQLQSGMLHTFMHNPLSGMSFTILTSTFSHKAFLHLLFNCLALESFGSAAYHYLVKEQSRLDPPLLESTANYHFLSFFVSAGLFSGLVSHVVSTKLRYPKLVAQLASPANLPRRTDSWVAAVSASTVAATQKVAVAREAASKILPSLGASGAIYSCVVVTALAFPEAQVALFIPPTYPVPIQWGLCGLVTLDVVGILRGWRFFDHWAHLGGAAFGLAYYNYGPTFWHWMRRTLQTEPRTPALH